MYLRLYRNILIVIYVLIICQVTLGQDTPAAAVGRVETQEESAARELRLFRDLLQQGSTEDIRVDAAVSILLINTAESQNVLLTALKSSENQITQRAVCKALIKSRGLSQTINSMDAFREPLLSILQSQSGELARLAAEALLLFNYGDISDPLKQIIENKELTKGQYENAIYALQLRPEPAALRELIGLLDNPNAEVSKAAEAALQETFGIPVGTSRKVWSDILTELQLKRPDEIRKERLLRQEMKLREVQTERDRWQKLYLFSLDKQYDPLDEAGRTKMILEMLNSDLYPIRLWGLDKAVSKYPALEDELKEKLLLLLSDVSRNVRLQAAKAFMNMSALNPAVLLLEQYQQEKDAEVRLAMFEALGEAVFFAFLPDSGIGLQPEIKTQTLSIASEYLESESPEAAIKGAEVVRKIIELNNLDPKALQEHLDLLNRRYEKSLSQSKKLRADLLAILARLCGQGGVKESACILYEPLFIEALKVQDNPPLRLAAAQGLSYINKEKALELFKEHQLMNDESLAVQQVVIDLAGQTGGAADLEWLVPALSRNGNSEQAWMAIENICQRQQASFLLDWLPSFKEVPGVKDEYIRDILDIAEKKAIVEKNAAILKAIQGQKIVWFSARKDWEAGAAYLQSINFAQQSASFKKEIQAGAMALYLASQTLPEITQLIKNKLLVEDFDNISPEWSQLVNFVNNPDIPDEFKQALMTSLISIQVENKPRWSRFVASIKDRFISTDPNSVSKTGEVVVLPDT